jgi:putative DNA primase/helicase
MTDGAGTIIDLIDSATVFEDTAPAESAPAPKITAEIREAVNAELSAAAIAVRAAEGDDRKPVLTAACVAIGGLVASGALHEGFARAALEDAAAAAGLVRDLKLRGVRALLAAGLAAGAKAPRDLGSLRRPAPKKRQSRPRPAAVIESSPAVPAETPADIPPPSASPSSSSAAVAPAPPAAGGESVSSQTGAKPVVSPSAGGGGGPIAPKEDAKTRGMRLAFFPLTDLGNAERFRERYKDKLLWCPAIGWLAWDGKRWSRDGADDLVKIAEHDTVRAIQREAAIVRDSGDRDSDDADDHARDFMVDKKRDGTIVMYSDKVAAWGRSSEAMNKLGALSKRGAPYFAIGIDKLDADKMKINVSNGTLVVNRNAVDEDCISFKPHDPADFITKISPVAFEPAATCDVYDGFLARVQPSLDMRLFLHQWLGLSMTGDIGEQKLAFLYGKGSNGKSVLVDTASYVAGDYGETVPIETFLDHGKARGAGQATPDLAILPGVRMLRTSEPEKNSKLAEAMIKLVTGGEPIQARHLNRDFFKFTPQFKLTMSGNYRPTIAGTDEGIWRRMRLVPFDVTIPKEERDPKLIEKLRGEASGILNRMLDGLRSWCDKGLIEPEDVAKATASYREDSDPFGRFAQMCLKPAPGQRVQSSALFELYEAWCKSSGEKAWSARGLGLAMKERGYVSKQSNVMWWLDISTTRSASEFVDDHGRPRNMEQEIKPDGSMGDVGDREF